MKIWFQNRRTKWKKQENISNAEAAEHKIGGPKHTQGKGSENAAKIDQVIADKVQFPNYLNVVFILKFLYGLFTVSVASSASDFPFDVWHRSM